MWLVFLLLQVTRAKAQARIGTGICAWMCHTSAFKFLDPEGVGDIRGNLGKNARHEL